MNISERLKEERKKLNLNQIEMAGIGNVSKHSQGDYEKGKSYPNAQYLEGIASVGADVQYIITGIRSTTALLADEQLLLERYRAANAEGKQAILGAAFGQKTAAFSQKYAGGVGQVIEAVSGDGLSFNVTMPTDKSPKPKK
jgi:transcriptional regulator with XRE-family HTH domain